MRRSEIYIDGKWASSASPASIEVIDPSTEKVLGSVPCGNVADVNMAVAAAQEAFQSWAALAPAERARYCVAVADGIAARREEIADVISREVGMPRGVTARVQVGIPEHSFRVAADLGRTYPFEHELGNSLVLREPVGVVACITPWNYPLHQISAKVAFAIAAGCTVVVKPSEVAPLNAFLLAEIVHDAGVPAGVFNLVTGLGEDVGEAMAAHPDVDMVSFTGSTSVGKRIAQLCAERVARVALELGGKSANLILPDADMETAVRAGVTQAFLNSGQTCNALTRILLPRERLADAERVAADAVAELPVGHPFDEDVRLGPLVTESQWRRVQSYIELGLAEGARLVVGGTGRPQGLSSGYFAKPTIFSDVSNDMRIAREEIFGPVLCFIPYDNEEQAVAIANDSPYGLGGAVWASDSHRAEGFARRMRTGQVQINGGAFNLDAPFGGYKQSGLGREYGRYGLEEFLQIKSLQR